MLKISFFLVSVINIKTCNLSIMNWQTAGHKVVVSSNFDIHITGLGFEISSSVGRVHTFALFPAFYSRCFPPQLCCLAGDREFINFQQMSPIRSIYYTVKDDSGEAGQDMGNSICFIKKMYNFFPPVRVLLFIPRWTTQVK